MKTRNKTLSLLLASLSLLAASQGALASEATENQNEVSGAAQAYLEDEISCAIDGIIATVTELESHVTLAENAAYLRPIKVLGGKAKAQIAGHGLTSARALEAVNKFIRRIKASAELIDRRYEIESTSQLAQDLEAQAEWLDDQID